MSDGNGALPEGWAWATVGDLISSIDAGRSPVAHSRPPVENEPAVLKVSAVSWGKFDPQASKALKDGDAIGNTPTVKAGDLLISRANTVELVGAAVIAEQDYPNLMLSDKTLRLNSHSDAVTPPFLLYGLRSKSVRASFEGDATGTSNSMRNISQAKIRSAPIVLPPLAEQRRIVSKIESLQERSSRARRALSEVGPLLEQFRRSVLRAAFSGRLTADWRAAHRLPAPKEGRWWVYAIECEDDSIYIGMTDDMPNRWKQHREGKGAGWTKTHKPRYVIHWEDLDSREAAAKREKELKSGYGRKWLKREREAGRLRQAGDVEPATELLSRIRTERRHRWEQSELAKYEAKGKKPPKNWQDKYKEPGPVNAVEIPELQAVVIGKPTMPPPEGWAWAPLVEVAELESGHTPRKTVAEYWDGGDVPWISLKDIRAAHGKVITETNMMPTMLGIENSSSRLLPEGTVCFSRDISVGFVTIMGREMATTQHFANWICGSSLDNKFLMYAFMAARNSLIRSGEGTTVRTIYMPALNRLHVLLPSIDEQREIVARIEARNEAIAGIGGELAGMESSLTQLDQSILAKAFRGELVPQDPRDEPASELLARIRTTREATTQATPKRRRKNATASRDIPAASLPSASIQRPLPSEPADEPSAPTSTPRPTPAADNAATVPIDETERNDVMGAIRSVFTAHSDGLDREDAIRHLAHELGYKRTGSRIHEILGNDLIAALKRRIISKDGDRYVLHCRTIEDYDRDDLVSLLQRAMGNTWWEEEDAIREATRLLGFRRTGRNITDTWKKTIALAIRRGELERNGTEIRRR